MRPRIDQEQPEDWERSNLELDFEVGGIHFYDAIYQDIVPDQRIVLTYEMRLDETRISVSLGTTEFKPAGQRHPPPAHRASRVPR